MNTQRPQPDLALMSAGWERNGQTNEYRRSADQPWLSVDGARLMAFGPPEPPAAEPTPQPPITLAAWDANRRALLTLLGSLQASLTQMRAQLDAITELIDGGPHAE